jgi:hypothetical protein
MEKKLASEAQIKLMMKLGLMPFEGMTVQEASNAIDAKLSAPKKNKFITEVKSPEVERVEFTPNKPKFRAHLSPEEVKCRALESAIEWCDKVTKSGLEADSEHLLKLADKFVEWIYE